MASDRRENLLILVENESIPFDRRVWEESRALAAAGYGVTVLCPNLKHEKPYEIMEGVHAYRYPPPPQGRGFLGYVVEFSYSVLVMLWMSIRVRRRYGFDAIHACGPPDCLYVVGRFHKWFGRCKFVFDHHDISPELYALRYDPQCKSLGYKALVWIERQAFRTADIVLATNESYKRVALERGGKRPEDVFVVRNGPRLDLFRPGQPRPELKRGRPFLVCYVGVMGEQDGLDYLLRAAQHIVHARGRRDVTFALIGSGREIQQLEKMAVDLDVADQVFFTHRISDEALIEYLSTADVCVGPDPENDFNTRCTFIKIAEYMAMGKPVVSFNLDEQRYTAQEAAVYVHNNDTAAYGDAILQLLGDPERRARMGESGRQRVRTALSWDHGKANLLAAYDALFGRKPATAAVPDPVKSP